MSIKRPEAAISLTDSEIDQIAKKMAEIDEAVGRLANGCYTLPSSTAPHYKVQQLCKYAERAGKDTSELTENELEMFRVEV